MQEMHENTHIPESLETAPLESKTEELGKPEPENPQPTVKIKKSPLITFIAVFALLLALAGVGAGVYFWKQFQIIQAKEQAKIVELETAVAKTHNALAGQADLLQATQQNTQKLDAQLQQLAKPKDWLLIGVDYQVKLAALNLAIDNNVILARKLLQAADQQLADANNVALLPIRQAIANDITALTAAPQTDIAGVIVKLNTLKQNVEQLPQTPDSKPKQPAKVISQPAAPASVATTLSAKAKDVIAQIGESLKELVVIRQEGTQSAPLLPPTAHAFVVTNIQAQLTMAQWAALHHQGQVYQQSITQAKDWINRYFAIDDPQVKAMQSLLSELTAVDVNPVAIDLSASLQAIQKLL